MVDRTRYVIAFYFLDSFFPEGIFRKRIMDDDEIRAWVVKRKNDVKVLAMEHPKQHELVQRVNTDLGTHFEVTNNKVFFALEPRYELVFVRTDKSDKLVYSWWEG